MVYNDFPSLLACNGINGILSYLFHNFCCNNDFPSLLACQNYTKLGTLLSKLFEHRNITLKQTN